ncbi:inositol monophosphatase [Tessaracoccus sp. HDW20]|uniref:inositol monophosphatase family protein n=1 Tax=Tessaracoccus coleopterorum TaxID=2714950 RepID=UPI0018D4003A|nr:inositol monophosphatase [Tessaracoccus coleopterorum]NHB83806.1 inositol monophosphatase [Tessaracoccus coleopterorum]
MDTDDILGLLQLTAAEVITPRFRQLSGGDIEEKGPGDLVTVADREAEAFLTRLLKAAHPSALVIGEEGVFADPSLLKGVANADHAFIIDPIDGTRNFVSGKDEHGVMLAEVRGGVTTRGWIWQPMTGRGYVAERGAGVRCNGEPIRRVRVDRPPLGATSRSKLTGFDAGGRLSPVVKSHFCCAFDYPSVLEGEFDFIYYNHVRPWDHLAGSLMVTENGGVARTLDGVGYTLLSRSRGLLVARDTMSWMTAQQTWPVS